jgi:hypothetical protein
VTAAKSSKYLIAVTGEISLHGCFVKTTTPFACEEAVRIRITSSGRAFVVTGTVVYALSAKGMGIRFGPISAEDQRVLDDWLADSTR